MRKRGSGPKVQHVRRYARWVKGDRRRVENYKRGEDPKPANRPSEQQLELFGND